MTLQVIRHATEASAVFLEITCKRESTKKKRHADVIFYVNFRFGKKI